MASSLEDTLTCPVCFGLFQDPQLLSCGHSFCRRCVGYHHAAFSAFNARTCPVCQQDIHQEPVSNLVLKNTCESYQRAKKEDGGITCLIHGEKILFYCKDDKQVLCSQCRRQSHVAHGVQPLTHTVHQRKDQIKATLRPAEKVLESLRNGTALECKVTKHIVSQAEQAEKQIKEEFETLHQFLREEEEARRAALREEEKKKKGTLEGWIEQKLEPLSFRLMEVEEEMASDDVTFLSNYEDIMERARYRPSASQLDSGSLIDVAKHVGNLRFRVWEKMKDLCPNYPVVLDPNSSDVSVSGDLVCVSDSARRFYSSNPLQKDAKHLVLGSEAQNAPLNCWDVEVGDSKYWTVGVCQRSAPDTNFTQLLTPRNGFWGLSRNGDFCHVLGSTEAPFQLERPLKMVRLKMIERRDFNNQNPYWMLKFLDARNESVIACTNVPLARDFFPFLVPEERNAPLRIVPVTVKITTENKFSLFERHINMIPLYVFGLLVMLCVFLMMMMMMIGKNKLRK